MENGPRKKKFVTSLQTYKRCDVTEDLLNSLILAGKENTKVIRQGSQKHVKLKEHQVACKLQW